MRKVLVFLLAIGFLLNLNLNGQDEKESPDYGIKWSGFVKNDFIFDTRQTVAVREGHFLLYPTNELLDTDGEDINARSSFNYLSIQSRLSGKITGPDAFGAKTSGLIEGAFFGQTNSDVNGFRLRHAYLKLNWATTELLLGQSWHMMFVTGCFPGTISFNTGVPFQYFSRNPQIRITQKFGKLSIAGMVATQRDFASPGGPDVLRNALLPDLQGQISYSSESLLAGVTAGYKKLLPRLQTKEKYKTSESIGGFTAQGFLRINTSPVTLKFQSTYAQNGYDGLFIGGYAVKAIVDATKDFREYTTINTLSLWSDIHTNGKKVQFGLFTAYSQNLGSLDVINELGIIDTYTRGYSITREEEISYTLNTNGVDIDETKTTTVTEENYIGNIYRISPRLIVNSGKTRFAFELEHTGAGYGDSINEYGIPQNLKTIANNRFLVAAYYFF